MPYLASQQSFPWQENNFDYTNNLFGKDIHSNDFYKILEQNLPAIFTRRIASEAIGGLISAKTLSNLDALGEGPSLKLRVGSKVGYERANFLKWLKQRMKSW